MAGDVVQGDVIISNHGDYRVVGVLVFDHVGQPVDKLPGLRGVRAQQIDFIAQRPHQQGRVVFIVVQQVLDIPVYAASVGVDPGSPTVRGRARSQASPSSRSPGRGPGALPALSGPHVRIELAPASAARPCAVARPRL